MANEHGLLPKADPASLAPALQRRLRTWLEKAYADDNLFLTLARRPAVLDLFLAWVSFVYTGAATVEARVLELCRIRLAARNACVH
jgi:hypothetical protein